MLANSVGRFESELRQLANELVQNVLAIEFQRALKAAAMKAPKQRKRRKTRNTAAPMAKGMPKSPIVSAASLSREAKPADVEPPQLPREWTREVVIAELGLWLINSKDVDVSFLKRHGPRGLVDAAKRIFGRFDAALNAANLAIAPRMEPKRGGGRPVREWPSIRELAQRQRARRVAERSTTTVEPAVPAKSAT